MQPNDMPGSRVWDFNEKTGEVHMNGKDGIKIPGYIGTWYVIDESVWNGRKVFLLEHEEYGDETEHLIVDDDMDLVLDDVWNGFSDLEERENEASEYKTKRKETKEMTNEKVGGITLDEGSEVEKVVEISYMGEKFTMTEPAIWAAYLYKRKEFQMADAGTALRNFIIDTCMGEEEDIFDAVCLIEDRYNMTFKEMNALIPEMADRFDKDHDCNVSENDMWRNAVEKVLSEHSGR